MILLKQRLPVRIDNDKYVVKSFTDIALYFFIRYINTKI